MKIVFEMDSISIEESCDDEVSQQGTSKLNDSVDEMNYSNSNEQKEHIEAHTELPWDNDTITVETNIPEFAKIDAEHKFNYECSKIKEIENMLSDNSSSKASCYSEYKTQVNIVEMDEIRNSVDCNDGPRNYDSVDEIIVIIDNDSEGELVNIGDIVLEIKICPPNGTSNSEAIIRSSSGREDLKCINDTEKRNVDPTAVKMDTEYELSHECLEIDKTEDADDSPDLVGFDNEHEEQMAFESNGSWDAVKMDTEYELSHECLEIDKTEDADDNSDLVGFDNEQMAFELNGSWDVKKEETDLEDVLIDNEKCAQDGTMSSENLKSTDVSCENNSDSSSNIRCHYCKYCGYKTVCKQYLKEHFRMRHDDNAECYKCQHCEYETQVNERHHCQHCAFQTKWKSSLRAHLEYKHNIVSVKGKVHQCQFCDYRCKFANVLKHHLESKHREKMEWHYCQNCEFKSKHKTSLRDHFISKHDDNAKWYKCCFCDFKTKQRKSIRRHFKTQHDLNSEWHNCQHCLFKTKHKGNLESHLERKHHIISEKAILKLNMT